MPGVRGASQQISLQKSVAFLCNNNEISEKEPKNTIIFSIASETIKYLGINLTKKVKYLNIEEVRL